MRTSLALLAFLLLPTAARAQGAVRATKVEVPLVRAHGLLYVELVREGEPLLALVDTGANASAIDPRRAAGLAVVARGDVLGTTGTLRAESVALEGLRLGELELPRLVATRRDLGGLLAPEGRRAEMILGSDALLGRALTLDFVHDRLALGPSAPPRAGAPAPGEVALRLDEGIPTVPATLAGLELDLRIDSGASLFASPDVYVNVPQRVWAELRGRDPALAPSSSLRGTGAAGAPVDLPVARLGPARIGPLALEKVHVIVQPEAGYFARPDAKGFVGVNWLEKSGTVTLDYGAGRLRATAR